MADLFTLRDKLGTKSISDMTNEELYEHLKNIRQSRRTVKANNYGEKKPQAVKKSVKPLPSVDITSAAASMSEEELMSLIKKMEGSSGK